LEKGEEEKKYSGTGTCSPPLATKTHSRLAGKVLGIRGKNLLRRTS
jgi:hypothetical protein